MEVKKMNNRLDNKILSLPLTGFALIFFAVTSTGILIINNLPIFNGSLKAEMLAEADATMVNIMIAVFVIAFALSAFSNLLMALLGVNAIRFSKNPNGVKARCGLAKCLIVMGTVSLIANIVTMAGGETFSEILSLTYPAITQVTFSISYLSEVKAINSKV